MSVPVAFDKVACVSLRWLKRTKLGVIIGGQVQPIDRAGGCASGAQCTQTVPPRW
jgi:hypothetical protein